MRKTDNPGGVPIPAAHFTDPVAARAFLESQRWPNGPVCPECGSIGKSQRLGTRPGVFKCRACRSQFSMTAGTILQDTQLPLHNWLVAIRMLCDSGIASARPIQTELGVTYRTAWGIVKRLRYAFTQEPLASLAADEIPPTGALRVGGFTFEELMPKLMRVALNPLHNSDESTPVKKNRPRSMDRRNRGKATS